MKYIKRFFAYIKPLWEGEDGKPSLKAVGAMSLLFNFIENVNWAIRKWEASRSFEGLSLILGIEAGLITALLGITAWSNMTAKKIDATALNPTSSNPIISVANADNVTTGP